MPPGDLRFDAFQACFTGDRKLRKTTYTPRVPREQNSNHSALNLSFKAAQGTLFLTRTLTLVLTLTLNFTLTLNLNLTLTIIISSTLTPILWVACFCSGSRYEGRDLARSLPAR